MRYDIEVHVKELQRNLHGIDEQGVIARWDTGEGYRLRACVGRSAEAGDHPVIQPGLRIIVAGARGPLAGRGPRDGDRRIDRVAAVPRRSRGNRARAAGSVNPIGLLLGARDVVDQ